MPTSHVMTTMRRIIAAFASIALITAFIPGTAIAAPTQDAPLTAQAADIARGTSGDLLLGHRWLGQAHHPSHER